MSARGRLQSESLLTRIRSKVEIAAKAMCLGGGLGAAKFPEAIAPYISKEGGATPFTAIENVGHRVLVESLST